MMLLTQMSIIGISINISYSESGTAQCDNTGEGMSKRRKNTPWTYQADTIIVLQIGGQLSPSLVEL